MSAPVARMTCVKFICRGMGLEYTRVTTVTDYPAAKISMAENKPSYINGDMTKRVKKYFDMGSRSSCSKVL